MSFEISTEGTCEDGRGIWSYILEYRDSDGHVEETYSDGGEETGTTAIQMKLMAILKALTHVKSLNIEEPIIIRSDCTLCIKYITREYECKRDDAFKRDKVTRGFVQYLEEIWWKARGLNVRFEAICSHNT